MVQNLFSKGININKTICNILVIPVGKPEEFKKIPKGYSVETLNGDEDVSTIAEAAKKLVA
jgi:hypothetical protein